MTVYNIYHRGVKIGSSKSMLVSEGLAIMAGYELNEYEIRIENDITADQKFAEENEINPT